MNRSVTPPANGANRAASPIKSKSPLRQSASARALVVQRRALVTMCARALGCAVAAHRLLPLPCKHVSRRPFRFAPGRASPRGCGGAGRSAASLRIKVPHPRLAPRSGRRVWLFGRSRSSGFGDAPRTTPSLHRGGSSSSQAHAGDPPPCRVPPKSAAPCSGAVAPHIERIAIIGHLPKYKTLIIILIHIMI